MDVYTQNKPLKPHNKHPPSKNTQETSYSANSQTDASEDSYKPRKSTNLVTILNNLKRGLTKSRNSPNPITKQYKINKSTKGFNKIKKPIKFNHETSIKTGIAKRVRLNYLNMMIPPIKVTQRAAPQAVEKHRR